MNASVARFLLAVCAVLSLLVGCDGPKDPNDPNLEESEFISYNGPSETAAAQKCTGFGYDSAELPDYHQACKRMLRADYCGDGQSWTQAGVEINFYDDLDINTDTDNRAVDAAWGPDGALCMNHIRNFRPGEVPGCFEDRYNPNCGGFENGALLVNEY